MAGETLPGPALGGGAWLRVPTCPPAEGQKRSQNLPGPLSIAPNHQTVSAALSRGFLCSLATKERLEVTHRERPGLFFAFLWLNALRLEVGSGEFKPGKRNPPGASRAGLGPLCAFGDIYFLACVGIVKPRALYLKGPAEGAVSSEGRAPASFRRRRVQGLVGYLFRPYPGLTAPQPRRLVLRGCPRSNRPTARARRLSRRRKAAFQVLSDLKFLFISFLLVFTSIGAAAALPKRPVARGL